MRASSSGWVRTSAIQAATVFISAIPIPRLVRAGVPIRIAAGDKGAPLLSGHGVFVDRDSGLAEHFLRHLPGDIDAGEIRQHQMVVRPAGNQVDPGSHEGFRPGSRHFPPPASGRP